MIKKMWAVFKDKKYSVIDNEKYEQLNKILPAFIMYEYKPVWVSDRDPHENVKRQLKIHKEVGDNLCVNCEHFADAIEEDVKNTEGAG